MALFGEPPPNTSTVPAVARLFKRTGLGFDDMALVELNEASACQVLAVTEAWGWRDASRINVTARPK